MISYGWGHGHVRVNNRAFERFGLAQVATDRAELRAALERRVAAPRHPERGLAELPPAAATVLGSRPEAEPSAAFTALGRSM